MNYRHTLLSLLLLTIAPAAVISSPASAMDTSTVMLAQAGDATPPAGDATPPAGDATAPAAMPAQGGAGGKTPMHHDEVARAVFTTGIKDREPVDQVTTLTTDKDKVYFFTEIRNMSGHSVKHRWEYNGKTMAEVEFNVAGPRWRVWSSKSLLPQWTGEWKVSMVDEAGKVLGESSFTYTQAQAK